MKPAAVDAAFMNPAKLEAKLFPISQQNISI
jgi:hypothetical protein